MKNVVLLGATGSIGTSSVDVILQHSDIFKLYAVAANSSVAKVAEIVRKFKVERVCMFNEAAAKELEKELGMKVLAGMDGLCELAADPKADIIINALMGAVGCLPTITAIEHGKHVALANKETMVMAGPVIWDKLAENPKSFITPIDSEHSAIFQCLSGRPENVRKLNFFSSIVREDSGGFSKTKTIKIVIHTLTPFYVLGQRDFINWNLKM